MSERLTKKTIKNALLRAPELIDCLNDAEREIALSYFEISNKPLFPIPDPVDPLLISAKRKIANAALSFVAKGKNRPLEICPKDIWSDDETMQSYLQEWLNIGILINTLQESLDEKVRNVVVQSIFNFHAKYINIEKIILDHEFMKRWPNV